MPGKKNLKTAGEPVKVGVIGGSGMYEIEGIKDVKEIKVKTPFGDPSEKIVTGTIEGVRCAFLPRHGKGHYILPGEVNYRANIYALKSLGVEQILSVSACGSLKEDVHPCDFLIPDQIYDRTKLRQSTFFGNSIVAHVGFAHPFCDPMRDVIHESVKSLGINHKSGGTYVCMEGPQFSTKAESQVNRSLGFSVIGMTALPEAKLAREAEICYATIALVTDYDVWKEGEEVSVETVLERVHSNVSSVKRVLKDVIPKIASRERKCQCTNVLQYAVMTNPAKIDKKAFEKVKLLLGKYIKLP